MSRLVAILLFALAAPAAPAAAAAVQAAPTAAAAQPSAALTQAGDRLLAYFREEAAPETVFAPAFLAAVPPDRLNGITGQLRDQHGAARRVAAIEPHSETTAIVLLELERAVLRMSMRVDAAAPHHITELLVTGVEARGDSLAEIAAEIGRLPGSAGFAVARLGGGPPEIVAAHAPERALAIGSTFKLIVLAELSRQIEAGSHRWSDVVTLERRSLPSGIMQDWPEGAPVTVHTLAALMISRSDNTATDALLRLVGRENVERMMERIGIAAAGRNRPFLSTLEVFALKAAPDAVRDSWRAGDEATRRRILAGEIGTVRADAIDVARVLSGPNNIDTMEWFASAEDMVQVMDWLRVHGGETALGVMTISNGLGEALPRGQGYVGFKGGSETGVINLTYLIRRADGEWYAVSGGWNDLDGPVEDSRFLALIRRAVQLVRAGG